MSVGIVVWFVSNALPQLQGLGADELDRLLETQLCLLAAAVFVLFAQAIFTIRGSFRSHDRFRLRLAAVRGDQGAIPQSDISVDPSHAPDISVERLEMLWRATRLNRRFFTVFTAVVCVVFGGFWLSPLYVVYLVATTKPIRPFTLDATTVVSVGAVCVGLAVVLVALALVIGVTVAHLPTERGKPYGVSAGGDGIMSYPMVGRSRLIRWEEMRLLEVTTTHYYPPKRHSYRLYGRDSIARWADSPPNAWASVGMPKDEFLERHQALLDLIAARTGLTPRTFDPPRRARVRIR